MSDRAVGIIAVIALLVSLFNLTLYITTSYNTSDARMKQNTYQEFGGPTRGGGGADNRGVQFRVDSRGTFRY